MKLATEIIPGGNAGIAQTLRVMDRLVDKALLRPRVIELAHDLVRRLPARDTDAEAKTIFEWVRGHFRYTHDPLATDPDVGPADQVKTPERLIAEIQQTGIAVGDCDDYVGLLLTLLRAVGIQCEPVVLSQVPGPYSHVMVRYASPRQNRWVTMDAITNNPVGWFPEGMEQVGSFDGFRIRRESTASVQGLLKGGSTSVAGYVIDEPVPGPKNRFARASRALSPYTDLMWWSWGTITLLAALGIVGSRRSARGRAA